LRGISNDGTWWGIWLTHCATNRKIAGSITDGATDLISPAALLLWGRLKHWRWGRCVMLTNLPPSWEFL